MKEKIKKWLKPVLFTAGGALVGLAYYYFVGCPTGACPLTSNPFITMAYMGFIGWLLSCIFGKGCSVQIAGRNGHLCHIRRTPKDIISGQPRTY